jgi:GT2 family glycosyltransferase
MPNKTVVFCTPGNSFTKDWVGCWTDLMFYCAQNRIAVIHQPAVHHNIHMVRDMCLGVNMGHKGQLPMNEDCAYDYLMWIDSDQVWENSDFQKLLDADEDIVAGWYKLAGSEGKGVCAGWYSEKVLRERYGMPCLTTTTLEAMKANEKGLIDLAAEGAEHDHPWVGMGFMLVKKGVFEKIPYPWFYDDTVRTGDVITTKGDDISFCGKAHQAGYKIHLHKGVKIAHQKLAIY